MKNLYATDRGFISLDANNTPKFEHESRESINRILLLKEPTHIVYNVRDKHIELDGQDGDILITFYDSTFETPIVLVNSAEWANNIRKYEYEEQKRKEEWAKAQAKRQLESDKDKQDEDE
jgi:hypothetical protein